jgi:DNA-directed RNA polymerase specialized sigma24 family protein
MSGELHDLLRRCRAGEVMAWEQLAAWVKGRGRAVLAGVQKLNGPDREDVVADTLNSLWLVIRRGEIRGVSNGEIDAYVCRAIRNKALNVLRAQVRRHQAGELAPSASPASPGESPEATDESPAQDRQVVMAEALERVEKSLLSWSPEDRYLFMAKLNDVSSKVIQETLGRPPFELFIALTTVDTRFHRLRKRLMEESLES